MALALYLPNLVAQQNCPVDSAFRNSIPQPPPDPCDEFTVESAIANCDIIYLRINVHFFLKDDCTGSIHPGHDPMPPSQAYFLAEDMINQANNLLANNQDQINADEWPPTTFAPAACVPIRFVLAGVHVHCDDTGYDGIDYWQLDALIHSQYAVNPTTELNYYFLPLCEGNGCATTGVGNPMYGAIDWLEVGNFTHELGHTLSLSHSWESWEGCEDTPPIQFSFDYNCNGIPEPNEAGKQCGEGLLRDIALPDPRVDRYKLLPTGGLGMDGIHDCDFHLTAPCPETFIPCCLEKYQNNNLMSYGYPKTAITACQTRQMLTNIYNHKCDFIEQVGGECAPPMTVIGTLPTEHTQEDCTFCLYFNASSADNNYHYAIYKLVNGQEVFVMAESPISPQNIGTVCFMLDNKNLNYHLAPNTTYQVRLTVTNECNESDVATLDFTTPDSDCGMVTGTQIDHPRISISPNPSDGAITVSFELASAGQTWIYGRNIITGTEYTLAENFAGASGAQSISANVSAWPSGNYFVYVTHETGTGGVQFIKN